MALEINIELKRDNFNLSFQAELNAGVTGLFGPSGSGKTTLLHCIAGLTRPDRGQITLNQKILYNSLLNTHLPPRKRQIGLVFQDHLLFPHLTVEGNLKYGQKNTCKQERNRHLCEIAALLDITHLMNRKVPLLSGGEKQRVALGRAILSSPRLLLLDEPFTGLDRGLKQQLIPYMKKLYERTQIPMILVSHSPEEMAELAEELFFIDNGKRIAQARFDKTLNAQQIVHFYSVDNPTNLQETSNLFFNNHSMQFNRKIIKAV